MSTTLTLAESVLTPTDTGYDAGRRAWNLNAEHRPAAVVMAANAHDVAAAVHLALGRDLGIGVLATGHGSVRPNDGVLVNTSRMRRVTIDPARRLGRVEAGAIWSDVIAATAPHGLTGLPGSSPGVGVVGFMLGGGFGWLGRRFGLASRSVTRAEVVTADGGLVVAGPDDDAELLWGLAGGTDNFGIVTSLEFELHHVEEVYGGNLYYPLDRARDLLTFFAEWSADLPAELTCAATFRSFPNLPVVPYPLRGGSFVAIRGAFCGDPCEGEALLDRARAVLGQPVVDTFARMPVSQMGRISMDPVEPLGAAGATELVRELTPGLVETLVRIAGPGSQSPLVMLELRTLGGALGGSPWSLSPMAHTAAAYTLNAVGLTSSPTQAEAVRAHLRTLQAAVRPHTTGETYLNFLDLDGATPERVRTAYTDTDWTRLVHLKDRYDPGNVFRFNRNVPPSPPHPSMKESI